MTVEVHPATADRFDDVASLLAPKTPGASACWCLSPRLASAELHALGSAGRPARMRELCGEDPPPGLLAYLDGAPVGWCAVGPRAGMGRLTRSRTIQQVDNLPVWSVICFVVKAGYRRRGIAARLLEEAVGFAAGYGAPAIEGYPIDAEGTRVNTTLAFVGTTSLFEKAGFERVAETRATSAGRIRWIMRRDLREAPIAAD
ncbi:Acetyltransferase (GNAT) family protein [Arthrobacter subterraneus]|uniref:Acetyltransferase (GNAT) family protein n=1 Tax=Arthrobacter subterraneus TaxID=335973 RepID=A0A1G8P7B3_9MICC|nr:MULTISPECIES: GNAT family N-acetyltransferase [Arthrobacter]SDI88337.1 Acetyltransferase (GNAT) family protein [Arthrobacter subterraneus]